MTHLQPTGNMEVVRLPALGDASYSGRWAARSLGAPYDYVVYRLSTLH